MTLSTWKPMTDRTVLVTGGAGYIGSHTCVVLLEAGLLVIVLDQPRQQQRGRAPARRRAGAGSRERLGFGEGDLREPHDTRPPRSTTPRVTAASLRFVHFAWVESGRRVGLVPLRY